MFCYYGAISVLLFKIYELSDVNGIPVLAWEVLLRYSHIKIFNVKSMDAMILKNKGYDY